MREALLTGIKKIELKDIPKPVIKNDTDVLIEIKAVGICGSDIHYYRNGKIGDQVIKYPFRIGHECSGQVVEVGKKVNQVKAGDRVAIDPAISCGVCDQCIMGRHHTCRNLNFMGCPGEIEGCLAEFIIVPEKCCYKLHHSINYFQGVLIEPISIGYYSVNILRALNISTVGILGSGPIGLSVLLNAKYSKIKRIYVTDKIDHRIHFAKKLGAYWTANPEKSDVVTEIQKQEPLLLDAVFECCGDQNAIDQAVDLLKPGGFLLIIGIPAPDRISFNISKIRRKEITIYNIRRQNYCILPAMEFILNNLSIMNSWVTHKFPLKKVKDAFDLVDNYHDNVIKAMIEFH
jgi:L-iditol 2-dehydrogenase